MNPAVPSPSELQAGAALLARPLLPLVRLLQLLYLAGPFRRIEELLAELPDPLETGGINYSQPQNLLTPYRDILAGFEILKGNAAAPADQLLDDNYPAHTGGNCSAVPRVGASGPVPRSVGFASRADRPKTGCRIVILDEKGEALSALEAVEYRVCHAILQRELETINSLLCAPCRCTLCCTGPEEAMAQEYFEIPLTPEETSLFNLPRIDTPVSRAAADPADSQLRQGPALYHRSRGWSMILPKESRCPQLDQEGGCRIYPQRPRVCRLPQIFSFLLEEQPTAAEEETDSQPRYLARHKLLAIWDCPYVQCLQEEVGRFAELSGLKPIFRQNKN